MPLELIPVSEMTFLDDIPIDAMIYVVIDGDSTPYFTTKEKLLQALNYSNDFEWETGEPQSFELPLNIIPKAVFHNRMKLLSSEYTVTGTNPKTVNITYTTFVENEANIITIEN